MKTSNKGRTHYAIFWAFVALLLWLCILVPPVMYYVSQYLQGLP